MADMEILEEMIAKIEASIDEYDEADTSVIYDSIDAITNAGYQSEAIEPLLDVKQVYQCWGTCRGIYGAITRNCRQDRCC